MPVCTDRIRTGRAAGEADSLAQRRNHFSSEIGRAGACHPGRDDPLALALPFLQALFADVLEDAGRLAQQRDCELQLLVLRPPVSIGDRAVALVRPERVHDGPREVREGEGICQEGEDDLGGERWNGEAR